MLLVSIFLYFLVEIGSGDVTVKLLGIEATPEQRDSYRNQLGLNQHPVLRYLTWLAGNDWWVQQRLDYRLTTANNPQTGEQEWWAEVDGDLVRWRMQDGELLALVRQDDGSSVTEPAGDIWQASETGAEEFWGVNNNNAAVRWIRGEGATIQVLTKAGFRSESDSPVEYIPLSAGLLRGDPGESLQTGRPVSLTLFNRVRNTFVLAFAAFVIVMPLGLLFGVLAGINAGRPVDRAISVSGLALTATPEFVTGILLILVFGIWLKWLPPTSAFFSADELWTNPLILVLPVLTLTAVELGYVARMTRASMVEVMASSYIRTAIIKGMPRRRVVMKHAVRNAMLAPITVIMLHVNWLIGGIVVVEVLFGYPGLGTYIYDAAIFGDFNALEAAAMLTVTIAVISRIIGDILYVYLNPRIRYS
ncbi:MAG: ABC transporter permease [Caldilineaceae bacterium]|nr:ABC transporter permease [Caldilineaceae bacterium]